jgi:hypothetical protein
MIDQVIARLEQTVPDLAGRVSEATQLAQLMEKGQLPQAGFTAFVLPGALRGGASTAAAGMFRQAISETVSVMLVMRVAGDIKGTKGLKRIDPVKKACIEAICGWTPDETTVGLFTLSGGELASLTNGTLTYVLDFSINDQLRITS